MEKNLTRYPLAWPAGWKRTQASYRKSANFSKARGYRDAGRQSLSVYDGVKRCVAELERMGIGENDLLISTNVETRMDGLPRSDRGEPGDPGVAVYWRTRKGSDKVMAVDLYDRVADNLAAIAATLDAMRAIERHGGAAILDRAFTGFTALPAPIVAGMKKPWRDVLEFFDSPRKLEAEDIQARWRRLVGEHHPDKGPESERAARTAKTAELNTARDEALQELKK